MSGRRQIVMCAAELLRAGEVPSLDAVARAVGMSKPGLMYHFPTKLDLMAALVEHAAARWDRRLSGRLGWDPGSVPATERLAAYVDVALDGLPDATDLAALADPRLRRELVTHWRGHLGPWLAVGTEVPAERRPGLLAVRAIADGVRWSEASGESALTGNDRSALRDVAETLLGSAPEPPSPGGR